MVTIFKTNVQKKKQAKEIVRILIAQHPLKKINFDLEDCDKILRIEGVINPSDIIQMVASNGYSCEIID